MTKSAKDQPAEKPESKPATQLSSARAKGLADWSNLRPLHLPAADQPLRLRPLHQFQLRTLNPPDDFDPKNDAEVRHAAHIVQLAAVPQDRTTLAYPGRRGLARLLELPAEQLIAAAKAVVAASR